MATILESFDIHSLELGRSFTIDLADGLDQQHLDFIESDWKRAMKDQRARAIRHFFELPEADQTEEKWVEIQGEFDLQDTHWEWRDKCRIAAGSNQCVFSLLNETAVEAAMLLVLDAESRDREALPIVYVDYLAVAPWNRRAFQNPQRFRHLGTVMIGAAVEHSMILGHDGRCGLHSLPQSEGFYRRIGMRDFGLDSAYQSLRYFEFDARSAMRFRQ